MKYSKTEPVAGNRKKIKKKTTLEKTFDIAKHYVCWEVLSCKFLYINYKYSQIYIFLNKNPKQKS